jgi:hypothetical protein
MSEVSSTRPDGNVIRTADLLGAFSLASDLALGMHMEHGARSCYIGMHIAQEMELPLEQRTDLYYAELLKDAGCTTYTSQLAGSWLVDELAAKRDLQFFRDSRNPLDIASWLIKYVAAGTSLPTRAEIEGIEGGGGAEVTVSGNPLGIVPGEPMLVARSTRLSYHDHGMDWEISAKNGFYSPFTYQGP